MIAPTSYRRTAEMANHWIAEMAKIAEKRITQRARRLPTICQAGTATLCAKRAASYSVPVLSMATRIRSHRSATLRSARA